MLAISELMSGPRPDLVLSGVNRGANLAEDVTMSGTVAGAIEGMAMGVPSIALSQGWFGEPPENIFAPAEIHAPGIVARLVAEGWPSDVVININFPNRDPAEIDAVEVTRQGFRDVSNRHAEKRTDLRGRDYFWMGFRRQDQEPAQGTDLRAIAEGRISVTPLHIDLTHAATVNSLKKVLGGVPPKL
jgi:5'-nucleotidase